MSELFAKNCPLWKVKSFFSKCRFFWVCITYTYRTSYKEAGKQMVMHLSYKQELFKGMRYYYYYMAGKKYGKISYITVFNIFLNPLIFKL